MKRSHVRAVLTAVPLVICNLVAFTGQLSFIRDHLRWPLAGDIGFAVGLESIAIFLAFMAHDALMAEDSAFRLRLGAYGAALVAASLNYSHYSPHLRPTFAAVGTALMSAASPWLWGTFSRRASRDALMAKGLIEPHAVRLGPTRWTWHPLRSARVMYRATWAGIADPREAVTLWQPRGSVRPGARPDGPPPPADLHEAIRALHAHALAAGAPMSEQRLATAFSTNRHQVRKALAALDGRPAIEAAPAAGQSSVNSR